MSGSRNDPQTLNPLRGPRAAHAQALRSAAFVAIAREQAAANRRRTQRIWCAAVLVAAGSVAAVFQSCAGSKTAGGNGADAPLIHSAAQDRKKTKGKDGGEKAADAAKSPFDQAATDLQAMFNGMGQGTAADEPTAQDSGATGAGGPGGPSNRAFTGPERSYFAPQEPVSPPRPSETQATDPPPLPVSAANPPAHSANPTHPHGPASTEFAGPPAPSPNETAPQLPSDSLAFGTVALCARVESFGRYVPLSGNRFLAGRASAAIVYIELDHFTQQPSADDSELFTVELSTQIELFHDDGSRQWRAGESTVRDLSRTRRRDFYLVQRIDLPANLSVGKYNLKIAVRDRLSAGEAETEMILPIQIVADPGLIGGADVLTPLNRPTPTRQIPSAPVAGPEPARRGTVITPAPPGRTVLR